MRTKTPKTKIKVKIGAHLYRGERKSQQDSLLHKVFLKPDPVYALALADGVGGEVAGDIASRLACKTFITHLSHLAHRYTTDSWRQILSQSLNQANTAISERIQKTPAYRGMATTFVGVCIAPPYLRWISVGDSHLYLWREGHLLKLNADHSMGAIIDREYALGNISLEEAQNAPYRQMITSCLQGQTIEHIDLPRKPKTIKSGDCVILASDGLNTLTQEEISTLVGLSAKPSVIARGLTKAVMRKKRPFQDNTAVVVAVVR